MAAWVSQGHAGLETAQDCEEEADFDMENFMAGISLFSSTISITAEVHEDSSACGNEDDSTLAASSCESDGCHSCSSIDLTDLAGSPGEITDKDVGSSSGVIPKPTCEACQLTVDDAIGKTDLNQANETSSNETCSMKTGDTHSRFNSARESLSELLRLHNDMQLGRYAPGSDYTEYMMDTRDPVSLDSSWETDAQDFQLQDAYLNINLPPLMEDEPEQLPKVLPFPVGESKYEECQICWDWKTLNLRTCCRFPACDDCLAQYFEIKVSEGIVKIECLNLRCKQFIHRDEVIARLEGDMKDKFYRFLIEANKDPYVKTCPRCSHVMREDRHSLTKSKKKKVPTATLR